MRDLGAVSVPVVSQWCAELLSFPNSFPLPLMVRDGLFQTQSACVIASPAACHPSHHGN